MNAQNLLDKYIKYNSKITFDIFKLMYQKLIDSIFVNPHGVEKAFAEFSGTYKYLVMKEYCGMLYFNQYSVVKISQSEISVEDLLGYNPFESFILPEKWCIKVEEMENTPKEIVNWRLKIAMGGIWVNPGYLNNNGYHTPEINQEYTEITFEQFKKYVLKEAINTPKEVVPEYVECYYSETKDFIINKIYKCESLSKANNLNLTSETGLKRYLPYNGHLWKFKPSTKEAFEAQNKSQSIEKWSVGSYIVPLQNKLLTREEPLIKGKPYQITKRSSVPYIMCEKGMEINFVDNSDTETKEGIKWFATLAEAEAFAKTLIEPVKEVIQLTEFPIEGRCKYDKRIEDLLRKNHSIYESSKEFKIDKIKFICWNSEKYWYTIDSSSKLEYQLNQLEKFFNKEEVKQPLEQAVHCQTQEEWDFACDKYNKTSQTKKDFPKYDTFDYTFKFTGWYTLERYIQKGYQILSFQEWCNLNGYKMTKTRFKKGDYVVSLRPERLSTHSIKYNYCYIQYTDGDRISVDYGVTMYEDDINYARLATPEEIAEYKRIGKPYDVTTLQSPTINTYGLNVGDFLDVKIINDWSGLDNNKCYLSSEDTSWKQLKGVFIGNRVIQSFKLIDGIVGFLVSGTKSVYLRAEGFKEFAENYYTKTTSNFKVGSWYKYNEYYLKYSKTNDRNIFIASEYIHIKSNEFKDNLINFTCGDADSSKELVTDLSVIQQYLPEGHPDKIIKTSIFEVGKWYKVCDGNIKIYNDPWYVKSPKIVDGIVKVDQYLYDNCLEEEGNFGNVGDYTFVEVPLSEIEHLLLKCPSDKIEKATQNVVKVNTCKVRITYSEIKLLKI